jgi:hypothetical protein
LASKTCLNRLISAGVSCDGYWHHLATIQFSSGARCTILFFAVVNLKADGDITCYDGSQPSMLFMPLCNPGQVMSAKMWSICSLPELA